MANPKTATNTAPVNTPNATATNFDEWSDEQIGFAPYWRPEAGGWFHASPIAKDARDPNFIRYLFKCIETPIKCHQGPGDGGEDIIVKPGETFCVSSFVQLSDPFDYYLGQDFEVPLRVDAKEKVKGGKGDVWKFRVRVSNATKALLNAARREDMAKGTMSAATTATAELPQGN